MAEIQSTHASIPLDRDIYVGQHPKLVLAFDVGTTYSGVSYSVLYPGILPQIKTVTRFPGQAASKGVSKIPTIVYYDQSGRVRSVGAEASIDGISEIVDKGNWVKAEWFKLHLGSNTAEGDNPFERIPDLPQNKSATQVFADFYFYLFECAAEYIQASHENGPALWKSVKDSIDFVLTHPNGWGGKEQSKLRRAAVLAGLIPDDGSQESQDRISFVTEGEASLQFVVETGVLLETWKSGEGVVIVDAGGGTIDLSSYQQISSQSRTQYEEIAIPKSLFFGSALVNLNAKAFLQLHLADSSYLEDLDHIVKCFDDTTKLTFGDGNEAQYVKFGSNRDNDPERDIRNGQLKLSGLDVLQFFKPSATALKRSILEQRCTANHGITHVVMVGGFSMNDWLFYDISAFLGRVDPKLNVMRPEESSKSVSHGAVSFYLEHLVQTRLSKNTYGAICSVKYDVEKVDHVRRRSTKFVALSGETRIPDMFCTILPKSIQVSETKEFRRRFNQVSMKKSTFRSLSTAVWCYRGELTRPRWKDSDPGNYHLLCTIVMDLSHLPKRCLTGSHGTTYFRVDYDLILLFGLTELKAQMGWQEDGCEKRSPAEIVYGA